MSQYPIDSIDGVYEAVNYLAAGPSGLGQDFQGFSSYTDAYVSGNFRKPFTYPTQTSLYVAPIALSTSEMLDDKTWKFTFASAQASAPFKPGNNIYVAGVTSTPVNWYNGTYTPVGVVSCTTTYVICQSVTGYTIQSPGTGGTISYSNIDYSMSTDCNARVIVTGAQDRVAVAAQLNNIISYTATTSSDFDYFVRINRFTGFINQDPVNPDYLFGDSTPISEKKYSYTGITGTGTLPEIETIFASIIDTPTTGQQWENFYWYILEVEMAVNAGDIELTEMKLGLRSLSAQVLKQ